MYIISVANQNPCGTYTQYQNNITKTSTCASRSNNVSGRGLPSKRQKSSGSRKGGAYLSRWYLLCLRRLLIETWSLFSLSRADKSSDFRVIEARSGRSLWCVCLCVRCAWSVRNSSSVDLHFCCLFISKLHILLN